MINYFLQNENGSITYGNWPISENGIEAVAFEITEEQLQQVQEGIKDWVIIEGVLSLKDSTRKADQEALVLAQEQAIKDAKTRKITLIGKISSGVATPEEMEEFANLL